MCRYIYIYTYGLSSIRITCCILFHIDSACIRHIQFLLDTYIHIYMYIYIYTFIYITDYIICVIFICTLILYCIFSG